MRSIKQVRSGARRAVFALPIVLGCGAAQAIWEPEGEWLYGDFDNDPRVRIVSPAGQYDPAIYFSGSTGQGTDTSDTYRVQLKYSPVPYKYIDIHGDVRIHGPEPLPSDARVRMVITFEKSLIPPREYFFSVDPVYRWAPFTERLDIATDRVLAITLMPWNAGIDVTVGYDVGFLIRHVPEPAPTALFAGGSLLIALHRRYRTVTPR